VEDASFEIVTHLGDGAVIPVCHRLPDPFFWKEQAMNRTYALVWSVKLGGLVAVPEVATRHGKASGCGVAAVLTLSSALALAMPQGGEVTSGGATISQNTSSMTVTQRTPSLSINWARFSIGSTESVTFAQPGASSIALNRVLGRDPSEIFGTLKSNGQVWLLNPNGVLFGPQSQVNVGGMVASTLELSDSDFLAGKRSFSGAGGSVINQGSLTAADGGYVALLGRQVSNQGTIAAKLGTVAIAGGAQITLTFQGSGLLSVQVDKAAIDALAENKQLIRADGGTVLLTARGADSVLNTVVNNTGVIEARTVESHNGVIKLLGGGGTVRVGGKLDASAPVGGDGGFVGTSGPHVKVADAAEITTTAALGRTGQWLIDPTDFNIAASGGDTTGAALGTQLNSTNVTILSTSGTSGGNGDIHVNDGVSWNSANRLELSALRSVNVNQPITNGGLGGVTLRADNTGACVAGASACGSVNFLGAGQVNVNGGPVNLYYNPPGSNNVADANGNGPNYETPNDYSSRVLRSGGSTLTAWMLVNDVNQLQALRTNLGGAYSLVKDIDASATRAWNGGGGFVPVGSNPTFFTGRLDGGGHVINGFSINRPGTDFVGLFGYSFGSVMNIGLVGASVVGKSLVGGISGASGGEISNSFVEGGVKGNISVGGLVGSTGGGRVANSYFAGTINANSRFGGLVGQSEGVLPNSHYNIDSVLINGNRYVTAGGIYDSQYQDWIANGKRLSIGDYAATLPLDAASGRYIVSSVVGLRDMLGFVDVSAYRFRLGADLDLMAHPGLHLPYFAAAEFDGAGHVISNLNVTLPLYKTAMFGDIVAGSTVKNLGLLEAKVGNSQTFLAGTLAGTNRGTVSNVHASGRVDDGHWSGGLVAENRGAIDNAYANVDVKGSISVGGLIAFNIAAPVSNVFSTGAVTSCCSTNLGGLIGESFSGSVTNGFWDITTSGRSTSAGGTGLTTTQMLQQASYAGFDFNNTWWMSEGNTRPFLRSEYQTQVSNAHQLQLMALNKDAGYVLTRDIDMSELTRPSGQWNVATGFVPVGSDSDQFNGHLDGAGHVIRDLRINMPTLDDVGLFGTIGVGRVDHVGLSGGSVTGGNRVGALVGNNLQGTLQDVFAAVDVSATSNAGGLVGRLSGGSLQHAYATGAVTGGSVLGGLAGFSLGTISDGYATGNVTGTNDLVGGLVGFNRGSISTAYATGSASGADVVGGLVGSNFGTGSSIDQAYSRGLVTGRSSAGGLVGDNFGGVVVNSYWDIAASGQATSAGGIGLSAAQMTQQASFAGFDLNQAWRQYEGHTAPLLKSFLAPLTVTADNVAKVYDGQAWTGALVNPRYSDPLAASSSHLFGTSQPYGQARNAGSYTPGLWSDQQGYDIGYVGGLLNIARAPLTVTTGPVDKVYDGTLAAAGSPTIAAGVLYNGDTMSGGAFAFVDKNAGTGKTVTVSGVSVNDGNAGANYDLVFQNNTNSVIRKAPLTVTAAGASKTYDAQAFTGGNGVTYAGFVTGESSTVLGGVLAYGGTSQGAVNAGSYSIVPSGYTSGNYTIEYVAGGLTINPKPIGVSISGTTTKVYNGNGAATIANSGYVLSGFVGTQSATVNQTAGAYNSKNVSQATTVTASLGSGNFIAGSGTLLSNYLLPPNASGVGQITPATLTYVANTATMTKGSPVPPLSGTVTGFVANDTLSIATSGTLTWFTNAISSSKAGSYFINGSGLTAKNGNYIFVQAPSNATAMTVVNCTPTKTRTCP